MDTDPNTDFNENEQGELYEHYRFDVDKGQGLLRIDKYLFNKLENISRNIFKFVK